MSVFALDKQKQLLMPCAEKRARLLLERGGAAVVPLAMATHSNPNQKRRKRDRQPTRAPRGVLSLTLLRTRFLAQE